MSLWFYDMDTQIAFAVLVISTLAYALWLIVALYNVYRAK